MKIEKATVYEVVGCFPPRVEAESAFVITLDDGRRCFCAERGIGVLYTLDEPDSRAFSTKKVADAVRAKRERREYTELGKRLRRDLSDAKDAVLRAEAALKAHKAKKPAKETN